jgi:hypothetical protein
VLHLRSPRDELGVLRPGRDGDDESVLVADSDFILIDPPVLLSERLPLGPNGPGWSLGTTEFFGDCNGEGEALGNDFLARDDVVSAVDAYRHSARGVLLHDKPFDPAVAETHAADAPDENLGAIWERLLEETCTAVLLGAATHLLTPPSRGGGRAASTQRGGAGAERKCETHSADFEVEKAGAGDGQEVDLEDHRVVRPVSWWFRAKRRPARRSQP